MASGITNIQLPSAYTPAYMPQWFTAVSLYYNQPNFTYTIKVTDVITGNIFTYNPPAQPDNTLTFNAEAVGELYVKNFIPINSYGWKVCTDAVRKIRVNIGETYDIAGVSTYTAGTDKDYYVWNSARDFLEFQNFAYTDFVYDAPATNVKYLTDRLPENTYTDRSNLFYALTSKANDIGTLQIDTYDASGSLIGTSYIANPQVASTTYTNKYLCIDLGLKGLTNISGALVTGTFPIITSSVAYYTVSDVSTTGVIPTTATTVTLIKRYTVACSPRYDIITIHALMKNGNYRSVHCPLVSERTSTNVKTTFKKLPYVKSAGGVVSYAYDSAVEQVLNVSIQDKLKVNTDWLTEAESLLYKQVVESPSLYMDLGSGQGYASVRCTDASYTTKKYYNEKLFQYAFNIEYTHSNHRQRA